MMTTLQEAIARKKAECERRGKLITGSDTGKWFHPDWHFVFRQLCEIEEEADQK